MAICVAWSFPVDYSRKIGSPIKLQHAEVSMLPRLIDNKHEGHGMSFESVILVFMCLERVVLEKLTNEVTVHCSGLYIIAHQFSLNNSIKILLLLVVVLVLVTA